MVLVAGLASACGGDKDSGACEATGEVTVLLKDASTGNPVMGSISWTDTNGDSGSMSCAGECVFDAPSGSVSVTATRDDTGAEQTESTVVSTSADCANPPFNGLEFDL